MSKLIRFLALSLLPVVAGAHHSFAMFDVSIKKTVTGVVKVVEWTNPHVWIHVDVVDDQGKSVEWAMEGGSPNMLVRQGYTSKTIKPGDKITVVLNPMKNGEPGGSLVSIQLADGRVLGSGTSLNR
jgi:hypothetical protein